jgi:hypothetical protein
MEIFLILLILFIVLDIAALRYGFNSRDDIDSPEWERLHQWKGFH